MATINQTVDLYQNQGALLGVGTNQIISFTNFQTSIQGQLSVDDANNDIEWDFGEAATFETLPATLVATGTAVAGVSISIPLLVDLTVNLSTPVHVAVITVDGVQYVRFYNPDGTEADPAALLDALATEFIAQLGPLAGAVEASVGDLVAYVENNALLNFTLSNTDGVNLIPCFTAGTLIATDRGEIPVEALKVGDRVMTVDHGLQPIRWLGSRKLTAAELSRAPNLIPIRIEPGALGNDLPLERLTVSPQHRCLVRSKIAERLAGDAEVLVAAKHLLGTPGISVAEETAEVTYIHLLFDRHELIWSNGAITESFYLGEQALSAVDQAARDEIFQLFPDLAAGQTEARPTSARPFMRGKLARKLVDRAQANRKPLVETPSRGQASGRRETQLMMSTA